MRYKLLGRSGLRVSELCLGTMTFGEEWGWGASKAESRKIFDAFTEAGGNFIDTADIYTDGTSEAFLSEFVKAERQSLVLSTKYSNNAPVNDANAAGNQRKNMVHSLEASLRRLGVDYIDLYWMHNWDGMTPPDEVMRAFDDLVSAGKVLYIGISDAPAWVVAQSNTIAAMRGWTEFVGLQIPYSLVERTVERELIPMARALDIGVTAWGALGSGLLTGKYTQESADEKRLEKADFVPQSEQNLKIARAVDKVAEELGKPAAQVALNWVRQQPGVIPILGARTVSQLRTNLGCLDFALSDEHMAVLGEVSAIPGGFPSDFLSSEIVQTFAYGGLFDRIDNHRRR